MKRTPALLLALATLALTPEARADRLSTARGQPLVEVSHSVDVELDDGVARYRVRRTFANNGAVADEAGLRIQLAHGAAVTGLRIRARERWYDGELMDAEEARAKYQELTGVGAWDAKDPALLQWVWADRVHLQVFPVLPGSVNTVEYTLTAPLEYRQGRYVLTYPHVEAEARDGSLQLADPVLRVRPGHGDATTEIRVAGQRVAPDAPVVLTAPPAPPWVGDGAPDPGASQIFSALAIDRNEPITRATVTLEIDHTYSGDLQVSLVTPAGEHLPVTAGASDKNDIRGDFEVALPAGATSEGTWHLMVGDHAGLDIGSLDAWSLTLHPARKGAAEIKVAASDVPRFIPDAPGGEGTAGHVLIEIAPPKIRTLAARLGRVVASAEHGFARLEIDAAPRLGQLPRKASVVFVLDTSRSVDEEELAAQLRIVAAYLTHVPDASVELVAFDRTARRVFGEFVGAAGFADALARARATDKLGPHNGSALELGLGLAADLLATRPGPTRVVALTDARLRTRFRNELALAALAPAPAASVTHLVIPEDGGSISYIRREDDHALAPIAAKHRGVLFAAAAAADDKNLSTEMLGLVRPIAIDHFAVRGIDLAEAAEWPEVLREGTGYRAMLATPDPTRRVVLTGKLWAAPVRRVVEHGEHFDVATAAFVFSEDEHHKLSDDEMRVVAYRGRAVSPVTSYLATEPGVRPSTIGLEEGVGGLGMTGVGRGGGGGGGGSIGLGGPPSLHSLLRAEAERCARTHAAPTGWKLALAIETTELEIVDVETTQASHPGMRDCVVEAAWALMLPVASWPERERYLVSFP